MTKIQVFKSSLAVSKLVCGGKLHRKQKWGSNSGIPTWEPQPALSQIFEIGLISDLIFLPCVIHTFKIVHIFKERYTNGHTHTYIWKDNDLPSIGSLPNAPDNWNPNPYTLRSGHPNWNINCQIKYLLLKTCVYRVQCSTKYVSQGQSKMSIKKKLQVKPRQEHHLFDKYILKYFSSFRQLRRLQFVCNQPK